MLQSIVSLRGPKVSLGTRSVAAKRSSNQSRSFTVVHASQSTAEQKVRVPRWDDMWATLKGKVRSVTPEEAHALIQAGKAVLVDVRPHKQFDASRPEGAQHSPIFRVIDPMAGGNFGSILKFVVMKSQGVTATETVPEFVSNTTAIAGDDKMVILACEAGGTLEPSPIYATGKQSRSLTAAYKLVSENAVPAERVLHLRGGVLGWHLADLPFEGDYDPKQAYATPLAIDVFNEAAAKRRSPQ